MQKWRANLREIEEGKDIAVKGAGSAWNTTQELERRKAENGPARLGSVGQKVGTTRADTNIGIRSEEIENERRDWRGRRIITLKPESEVIPPPLKRSINKPPRNTLSKSRSNGTMIQDETDEGNMTPLEKARREAAIHQATKRERMIGNLMRVFAVLTVGAASEMPVVS